MAEEFPKLYLAQIPNFLAAYHRYGKFEAGIKIQSVTPRIKAWEKKIRNGLAYFSALLPEITKLARASNDGKVELVRTEMGELEVREWGGNVGDVISEATKVLWRAGKEGEVVGKPKDDGEVNDSAF